MNLVTKCTCILIKNKVSFYHTKGSKTSHSKWRENEKDLLFTDSSCFYIFM